MKIVISVTLVIIVLMIGLNIARSSDEFRSYLVWRKIDHPKSSEQLVFEKSIVQDLPDPARRYFEYTIAEGTALKRVAYIKMEGQLGLGPKEAPYYMDMQADQILAFPQAFVWRVKTGRGPMVLTGSDGFYQDSSWSRFWLMHSIPIGRAGGLSKRRRDHLRAAFGRLVAETAFWSPTSLLPSDTVRWEAIDQDTARVIVHYEGLLQDLEITVTPEGKPVKVVISRWSDANPEGKYQLQPFGGYMSEFEIFEGYRLPTHVEGGNFIGTEDYFPFYIADVKSIKFLD